MKRVIIKLGMFLLLGAVVNVATCIAIMLSIEPRLPNARQRSGTSPDGFLLGMDRVS